MKTVIAVVIALAMTCCCTAADADHSAVALLRGFDVDRIARTYSTNSDHAVDDLSKLLYQLRRTDVGLLERLTSTDHQPTVGDAIAVEGEIRAIKAVEVPTGLVDSLGFRSFHQLTIQTKELPIELFVRTLPARASVGDGVSGLGVVLQADQAVACEAVRWTPAEVPNLGWQLLRDAGVDLGELSALANRNRRPLVAADSGVFYDMLRAAAAICDRGTPPAATVGAVGLLREPDQHIGQWLRLEIETIQVTRVAISEPDVQQRLGSDRYYQIDAISELPDDVIVVIKPDDPDGQPATFENRFPVSLVIAELPDFLVAEVERRAGDDAVVSRLTVPITVDGFFFRLWSYDTEYMRQFGDGKQFGPLVIGAKIISREPDTLDPLGVRTIGWLAAIGILAGLAAVIAWTRVTARNDAEAKARRTAQTRVTIEIPEEST